MMAQAKGALFYPEHVSVARGLLDNAEIGQLFLAVCDYAESGTVPDFPSKQWGVCFNLMRGAIDKNAQKYAETCARNREKANKRWNNQHQDTTECSGMQQDTTEYAGMQTHANDANRTEPNRTEQNRKEKSSSVRAKRFTPPTVEEVRAYCEERRNSVDAQYFIDFYTAKGWKIGKNSMKDWKAAVHTWERRDSQKKGGSSLEETYGSY